MSFNDLVSSIRIVDAEAAAALEILADTLPKFYRSDTLEQCFQWVDSPQGQEYWAELEEKLLSLTV